MKKIFLIPIFFCILFSPLAGEDQTDVRLLSADETVYFENKLAAVKNNIDFLAREELDREEFRQKYSEAENIFFSLRYAQDLKDPDLLKKHLQVILEDLAGETGDSVAFVKRMELLYRMMLSMGLVIVFLVLIYSIYMYARRK